MRTFAFATALLGLSQLSPALALLPAGDDASAPVAPPDAIDSRDLGTSSTGGTGSMGKRDLSDSCSSCTMVNHSRLSCSCKSSDSPRGPPNFRTSTINLDACFGNRFGDIIPQDSGFLTRSCTNLRVYGADRIGGFFLEARCYDSRSGTDQWSHVSLGAGVANSFGTLTCFSHRGT